MYQTANLDYVYAPMPVWIPPKMRTFQHPENYGVSFIGSRDVQRERLLVEAIEKGVALEIRGASWFKEEDCYHIATQKNRFNAVSNQWCFLSTYGLQPWIRKLRGVVAPILEKHCYPSSPSSRGAFLD